MTPTTTPAPMTHEASHAAPWRCAHCGIRWDSGVKESDPCPVRRPTLVEQLEAERTRADALAAEVEALRGLAACAYQMAGVHDAPVEWLDALSDAANGLPFDTENLLPYMPDAVCKAEAKCAELEAVVGRCEETLGELSRRLDWLASFHPPLKAWAERQHKQREDTER